MNFELNDDQQAYIASAKAFSDNELAPNAAHWDAESVFAKEALKAAGDLGFMGMYTPEAAGGLGMGRLDASLIVEELANVVDEQLFTTAYDYATRDRFGNLTVDFKPKCGTQVFRKNLNEVILFDELTCDCQK